MFVSSGGAAGFSHGQNQKHGENDVASFAHDDGRAAPNDYRGRRENRSGQGDDTGDGRRHGRAAGRGYHGPGAGGRQNVPVQARHRGRRYDRAATGCRGGDADTRRRDGGDRGRHNDRRGRDSRVSSDAVA